MPTYVIRRIRDAFRLDSEGLTIHFQAHAGQVPLAVVSGLWDFEAGDTLLDMTSPHSTAGNSYRHDGKRWYITHNVTSTDARFHRIDSIKGRLYLYSRGETERDAAPICMFTTDNDMLPPQLIREAIMHGCDPLPGEMIRVFDKKDIIYLQYTEHGIKLYVTF